MKYIVKYYLYLIHKKNGLSHLSHISDKKEEIDDIINIWKKYGLDKDFNFKIQKISLFGRIILVKNLN